MNETELIYGKGIKTEKDVVILCLNILHSIEEVVDIKKLDIIHEYISSRYTKLNMGEENNK